MEEKKKSRLPVIVALAFVLVLAGLYIYLYIFPDIGGSRLRSVVVNFAQVQEQARARCIVARKETVFSSGGAGSVSYYIEEGHKTRVGILVADVYSGGQKKSFYTSATGTVSYFLDGQEAVFAPDKLAQLDPDEVADMDKITPESEKPKEVEEDTPIFKQVNSDIWYVVIVVTKDEKGSYKAGQEITVKFNDTDQVPATVTQIVDGKEHQLAIAKVTRYYDKFCQLRTVDATIITSVTDGLLVPSSALTTNGENVGVYVLGLDGKYSFKAVEILIEGDTDTLIADGGAVKQYDEVLKDARNYKE